MKKLLNIILFLFIFLSCKSQDSEIDSTIKLLQSQISDLYAENYELKQDTAKLLFFIDSLGLVIEGLEANASSPLFADTAYFFVMDSTNSVEVNKVNGYIRTQIVWGGERITTWGDGIEKNVFFMSGNDTNLSVTQDTMGTSVNFKEFNIEIK